jgi:hypothetical protein
MEGNLHLDSNNGHSLVGTMSLPAQTSKLTAKKIMTLATGGDNVINAYGDLTLEAGSGIVILNSLIQDEARPMTFNADSDSNGEGALTVAAAKTVSTAGGDFMITAFDLDAPGSITATAIGSMTIHGSTAGQSIGFGCLDIAGNGICDLPAAVDANMLVADQELGRMAAKDFTLGSSTSGHVTVTRVTPANSDSVGPITIQATKPGFEVRFKDGHSEFDAGVTVQANARVYIRSSVNFKKDHAILHTGTGTLDIATSQLLTLNIPLVLTTNEVVLGTGGSINTGTGSTKIYPTEASRQVVMGGSASGQAGVLSLTDTELASITSNGLSVGSSTSGDVKVSGVSEGNSNTQGTIQLIATKPTRTVTFQDANSFFAKGIVVQAASGGQVLNHLKIKGSESHLHLGTGAFQVASEGKIITVNQHLLITADSISLQGGIDTYDGVPLALRAYLGSAGGKLELGCATPGRTVGLGSAANLYALSPFNGVAYPGYAQMGVDEGELQRISTSGLVVGGKCGQIVVDGIENSQSEQITGIVTLSTFEDTKHVHFVGHASTFNSIHAQADNGVNVEVDVYATGGSMYLDGDVENAPTGGMPNYIDFLGPPNRTLTASTLMTLESSTGAIKSINDLSLKAGAGLVIQDNLNMDAGKTLVMDADYDSAGDGVMTVSALRTVNSYSNTIVTAFDIEIAGFLQANTAALSIHGSGPSQTISVGIPSGKQMHLTNMEINRIVATEGITIGSVACGEMSVGGISEVNTKNLGTLTLVATKTNTKIVFKDAPANFHKGIVVQAGAGVIMSEQVTTKAMPTLISTGPSALTLESGAVLSTNGHTMSIMTDDLNLKTDGGNAVNIVKAYNGMTAVVDILGVTTGQFDAALQSAWKETLVNNVKLNGVYIMETSVDSVVDNTGGRRLLTAKTRVTFSVFLSEMPAQAHFVALTSLLASPVFLREFITMASSKYSVLLGAQSVTTIETRVTNGCYSQVYTSGAIPSLTLWNPADPSGCPNTVISSSQGGRRLLSGKTGRRLLQQASTTGGASGLDTGGGMAVINVYRADRDIAIGTASGSLHIDGAELGRITALGGLTVGSSTSGDITVDGVTTGNTGTIGTPFKLVSSRLGGNVIFANNPSAFANGVTVLANNGIRFTDSFNTGGPLVLYSGYSQNGEPLASTAGIVTVGASRVVNSVNNNITITAVDVDLVGDLSSGTGTTTFFPSVEMQTIGVGASTGQMTISGLELQKMSSSKGLTIGTTASGTISVSGVTVIHTANLDKLTLLASRSTQKVIFENPASTFDAGVHVQADAGILVKADVTTKKFPSVMNAGPDSNATKTGTNHFTIEVHKTLSTTDQDLSIHADEVTFEGTTTFGGVSTGSGNLNIMSATPGLSFGIGAATTEQVTLDGSELRRMNVNGLLVGGSSTKLIKVANVTKEQGASIFSTFTLQATADDGKIVFEKGSSTFGGIAAQADDGVEVNSQIYTSSGIISLDGDYDNSPDTKDKLSFGGGVVMTAYTMMTLKASQGILPEGTLGLNGGTGIVLTDNLIVKPGKDVSIDSSKVLGDGTLTVVTGKSIESHDNNVVITAWDLDLQGTIDVKSGTLKLHANDPGGKVGLGNAVGDALNIIPLKVSGDEIQRITALGGLTVGSSWTGDMTVDGIEEANLAHIGSLKLLLNDDHFVGRPKLLFEGANSAFDKGLEVKAAAGVILSASVTTKGAPLTLNTGTGSLTVTAAKTLSTTNQLFTIAADNIDLDATSVIDSGSNETKIDTYTQDKTIGLGATNKMMHISDAELGTFHTSKGLTVGGSMCGELHIGGVTDGNSDSFATLKLVTTSSLDRAVVFSGLASSFNKGILVQSNSGIKLETSVTTRASTTSLNPGTGTITVMSGRSLISTNQILALTSDDIDLSDGGAKIDSGTAETTLRPYTPGHLVGIGEVINPGGDTMLHLNRLELSSFNSLTGVTIGDNLIGDMTVDGIQDDQADALGMLTLIATKATSRVIFSAADGSSPSLFNKGITVQAGAGVIMSTSLTTKNSATYINSGRGALTMISGTTLSSTNQLLTVLAPDFRSTGAQMTTGSSPMKIGNTGFKLASNDTGVLGIGVPSNTPFGNIDSEELQNIVANGLILGVPGVSGSLNLHNMNPTSMPGVDVNSAITVVASTDNATITFSGAQSTFARLTAQASAGIKIDGNVGVHAGGIYLDGDMDKSKDPACAGIDHCDGISSGSGANTLHAETLITLESRTGGMAPNGPLTLQSKMGILLVDSMMSQSKGHSFTLLPDLGVAGDGTLTIAQGAVIGTNSGNMVVTAWDIDLPGSIDTGKGHLEFYASVPNQGIGIGVVSQEMTITDEELMRMTPRGGGNIRFYRNGEGTMIVHSVSRKYSARVGVIGFGGGWSDTPEFHHTIYSSKNVEAGIQQRMSAVYNDPDDFTGSPGMARVAVSQYVEMGAPIVVTWDADVYTATRLSHKFDWIGLYYAGTCDDDSDANHDSVIHQCYVAWKYVDQGIKTGQLSFPVQDYKLARDFEVRYFYGNSNGGHGYSCVQMGGATDTYKRCTLRARATSSTAHVTQSGSSQASQTLPGLNEHKCDGNQGLCTW